MSTEFLDELVFGLSNCQDLLPNSSQLFGDCLEYLFLGLQLGQQCGDVGLVGSLFELHFVDVGDEGVLLPRNVTHCLRFQISTL
jgi:hypothetical protein